MGLQAYYKGVRVYGKRGPWAGEKGNGAAYVMPDWAGRVASLAIIPGNISVFLDRASLL